MIHFTSDTHYGHANVIKYSQRPYKSVEDMDKALIENWNSTVRPGDVVWHLGDVAFSPIARIYDIFSQLNGEKHLILGNHDKIFFDQQRGLNRDNIKMFKSVQHYKELRFADQLIVLFHYGSRVWDKAHYGSIMLYGHSHGSLPPWGKSVDVGVDSKEISPEYRPYSLTEILQYMENRNFKKVDHHG